MKLACFYVLISRVRELEGLRRALDGARGAMSRDALEHALGRKCDRAEVQRLVRRCVAEVAGGGAGLLGGGGDASVLGGKRQADAAGPPQGRAPCCGWPCRRSRHS